MIPRNPMRPQGVCRQSRRYPGLVLELDPPFLTFRRGRAFEVYKLAGGNPTLLACSPRGYGRLEIFEHTRIVAIAYAEALAPAQLD